MGLYCDTRSVCHFTLDMTCQQNSLQGSINNKHSCTQKMYRRSKTRSKIEFANLLRLKSVALSQTPLERFMMFYCKWQVFVRIGDLSIRLTSFFQFLKRRYIPLQVYNLFWAKYKMIFIRQASVPKRMRIWHFWSKYIKMQYCSYIFYNLINIGPVTSEITSIQPNISTTSNCVRIVAKIARFNSVNFEIIGWNSPNLYKMHPNYCH